MDFTLSEENLAIQTMAAEFSKERLTPNAAAWDKDCYFPKEVLKDAAKLGMAGIVASENIGGSGLTRLDAALIFEQLAVGCVSTSAYLSIHNMVTTVIDKYADEALRQAWGPKLTSMQLLASYCLTEPDSGSDAASLKTKAIKQGDYYIINGAKAFISGAGVSDLYLCMVRTGDETHHGISCIIIEKDTPGLSFGNLEHKMGWKSQPTAMVFFEDCRVLASNLVGAEGQGFKIALNALNGGRINIAACSLGGAWMALKQVELYLSERKQFGKYLNQIQILRFYMAEMLIEFEAARLMVYRAADALDKNDNKAPLYCAMAKKMATEVGFNIVDKALQMHGGYGYLQEYQLERVLRDLRVHRILEGTNEIMNEVISKIVLDEKKYFNI